MKAAVYRRSTGLIIEEVPALEPGAEFVLIKVSNTGFCGSDYSLIESGFVPDGTILGHEVSVLFQHASGKCRLPRLDGRRRH